MDRRKFLEKTALSGAAWAFTPHVSRLMQVHHNSLEEDRMTPGPVQGKGEMLYNNIRLPADWPPGNMDPASYEPMPVPWLQSPPEVIPIDKGRQLFVDDFLIEHSSLQRFFHKARKYDNNPVFQAETDLEKGEEGLPVACPKDGGVWWDPDDQLFKMWYEAAWIGTMAYATSTDGINWHRPELNIRPGTNQIVPGIHPDSTTVFLDHDASDPRERFKMFLRGPNWAGDDHGFIFVSADGIHWSDPVPTGLCGDRSTMFYNPFRKKWIYSIRSWNRVDLASRIGRARYYHECHDFIKGARWNLDDVVFWTGADKRDPPDLEIGEKAQLYNLSAVAYESIMLGFHQIHLGPRNEACRKKGMPKITELMLSYSRDGFHWHRPDREAFIPATRREDDWERGYVQSVGGICTIVGDQLRFYYTGFKGDPDNRHPEGMKSGMYANGSTGIAVLRRDGFASMSSRGSSGSLTTRPVIFRGSFLYVNTSCIQGELRVEILNEDHSVIPSFTADRCDPISTDSTIQPVSWNRSRDLSTLAGKNIRFRFYLKNGELFSFWISPDENGASYGYPGAGGPGFTGGVDDKGTEAYKKAAVFPAL